MLRITNVSFQKKNRELECTVTEFVVEEEEMFIGSLDACVDQDDALLLAAACHSNGEHCMWLYMIDMWLYMIVWMVVDHWIIYNQVCLNYGCHSCAFWKIYPLNEQVWPGGVSWWSMSWQFEAKEGKFGRATAHRTAPLEVSISCSTSSIGRSSRNFSHSSGVKEPTMIHCRRDHCQWFIGEMLTTFKHTFQT